MDRLAKLINEAFRATVEAEKLAGAGPRGPIYRDLLEAHSALLRAKNRRRAVSTKQASE